MQGLNLRLKRSEPVNSNTIEIQGTLQPDGRLILDEKPALPPGRVRGTLQAVTSAVESDTDVLAVLHRIRAARQARGEYVPRTRHEIDAAIDAMRGEDEERMQTIERLHEECQRTRRETSAPENS
jgi:DNA-binding FrmR family transcriptional regulator